MYIEPRLPDHTDIWTANLNNIHGAEAVEYGIVDSVLNKRQ